MAVYGIHDGGYIGDALSAILSDIRRRAQLLAEPAREYAGADRN